MATSKGSFSLTRIAGHFISFKLNSGFKPPKGIKVKKRRFVKKWLFVSRVSRDRRDTRRDVTSPPNKSAWAPDMPSMRLQMNCGIIFDCVVSVKFEGRLKALYDSLNWPPNLGHS